MHSDGHAEPLLATWWAILEITTITRVPLLIVLLGGDGTCRLDRLERYDRTITWLIELSSVSLKIRQLLIDGLFLEAGYDLRSCLRVALLEATGNEFLPETDRGAFVTPECALE